MALAKQYMTKEFFQDDAPVEFRFAQSHSDFEEVGKLRFEAYKDVTDQVNTKRHPNRIFLDESDQQSYILMAEQAGRLVGTGRFTLLDRSDLRNYEFLQLEDIPLKHKWPIMLSERLAVAPDFRGGLLSFRICEKLIEAALHKGAQTTVAYVLNSTKPFMEKLGLRKYLPEVVHQTYGSMHPMYLPLEYAALKELRSPFLRAYRNYRAQVLDMQHHAPIRRKKGRAA